MLEQLISIFDGPFIAIWGPFFLLLICGLGLPVPEDIILIAAGFLAASKDIHILAPLVITYVGIMGGDSILFLLGRRWGPLVLKTKLGQLFLSEKTLVRARKAFSKYGRWVNFFGRFLPGVRAAIFFTGGTLGYSFRRFFFMDGLAALLSAPIFVCLGYFFGLQYEANQVKINEYISTTKNYLSLGLCILLLLVGIAFYIKKRRTRPPLPCDPDSKESKEETSHVPSSNETSSS